MKRNTDIRWCQAADCEISGTANWRRVKRTNEMAGVLPIDWPVSRSDGFSFSKLVPHQFDSSGRAGGRGGEKNKTRGGVCKVRPRTFSPAVRLALLGGSCRLDVAPRCFTVKVMQLLAQLQAVGQAFAAPPPSVYGLISALPFHVSTIPTSALNCVFGFT